MQPSRKQRAQKEPETKAPALHAHRVEDYLVTTYIRNRPHKLIWNAAEKPLPLDFPVHWVLEKTDDGIRINDISAPEDCEPAERCVDVPLEAVTSGEAIEVPPPWGKEGKPFHLRLYPLRGIRPAYAPSQQKNIARVPHQVFLFHGTRKYLINYRPATNSYRGIVENAAIFGYRRTREGYELTAYKPGVHFRTSKDDARTLSPGDPILVSEDELSRARISFKKHWWRLNRIPLSPPLPPEIFEDDGQQEKIWFARMVRRLIYGFIGLTVLIALLPKHKIVDEPLPQVINLQKPHLVQLDEPPKVVKVEPPKPKPKPPEPPKAKPPPPEPVKHETKTQTKPVKQPHKQVTHPPPPPPPPKSVVPPKPGPSAAPPPPIPHTPEPTAAQIEAKAKAVQKAELAKSLSFLSPNSKVTAKTTDYSRLTQKMDNAATGPGAKIAKNNVLNNMAGSPGVVGGSIDTKGSRNINAGNIVDPNGSPDGVVGGKGQNHVRAKVALDSLYNGGDEGGAVGGGGITMSGSGQVDEKAVMAALAKRLQKLQYCYEKALLSDGSLSGNVMMEWTISEGGQATNVHVVKSQMNNKALHSCIAREIGKVQFPSPKGGPVIIKYPFNFTSSAL